MDGLMMEYPLTLPRILERASRVFARKEVISLVGDTTHRYTYGNLYGRVLRLMDVLRDLGVGKGDRVATFAWNHFRHLELYHAVPALGAVLHTLNIRLPPEQLAYIVNHAEDSLLFVDESLAKPLAAVAGQFRTVRNYIVMSDQPGATTGLPQPLDYEALMAGAQEKERFPDLKETDACGLCYTSGTTGNPKGVLYSHRSMYLHSLMCALTDTMGLSERDVVLPIVPMFHVNAWGQAYAVPLVGASLVFNGPFLQPQHIVRMIAQERVTLALGVPTIWNGLLQYLRQAGGDISSLRRMVVGGSSVPRAMIVAFQKEFGVPIIQGWGMTEMSPVGSTMHLTRRMEDWPEAKQFDALAKAGIMLPGVEMKLASENDDALPWDGETKGELLVRGAAIASSYFRNEQAREAFTADGWFRTGDLASIDADSVLTIHDRTKDLIKSGGEWISSVDMENTIMACPGVLEAAVVARPDVKWDERPVAFVVRKEGAALSAQAILEAISAKFIAWQLPSLEDIQFVEQIPKTSVGKFDKKALRARLVAPA
ncbi:MAG: long-chain fatty acid--CoA ligase [Candidatus Lambdaproteobacteria bacterium]|nr:long-chain fatty acid--CoA ligase [Candidatus Lambdaproteobacteria bacterium]